MSRNKSILLITFFLCVVIFDNVYAASLQKQFLFDKEDALSGWTEKVFRGKVLYEVITDPDKGTCLSARSNNASSGLFYRISFNPRIYPYISWNWKVSEFPAKAKTSTLTKKDWIERDDYAARVYVIFPSLIFTNIECLEYVWAQDLPKGEILTSPFFKNIKLIIVDSGEENIDRWVKVERNIAEDYKKAFGRPLRRKVGAIALMTDSDNTQSNALSYYADIKVGYAEGGLPGGPIEEGWDAKFSNFVEFINKLLKRK